jgi:hypothetical protein
MVRIIGIGFSQNNKTRDELKSPVRKSFNNPMGAGKPSFAPTEEVAPCIVFYQPIAPMGQESFSNQKNADLHCVGVVRKKDLEGRLRCPLGAKGW